LLNKRFSQYRPLVALAGVVLAWILLPAFAKSFLRVSFYEFQAPLDVASSYLRDLQSYWAKRSRGKDELLRAARDLARLNASYELAVAENKALAAEVRRLEKLLQLPSRTEYRYEIARVARRDFSSWWQTIDIRKGRRHEIHVGAPVVFVGGLVGRVREVHAYTATVELLSNAHLRLAVVVEGDNRPISFRGAGSEGFGNPRGIAEYVPSDIRIGDPANPPALLTSGMGGVYPPGLRVGRLVRLRAGAGGMFLDGEVRLDPRLKSVSEVAVLVPIAATQKPPP